MRLPLLLASVAVLTACPSAWACSVVMMSIGQELPAAAVVVIGQVESLQGELLGEEPEADWVEYGLASATFRIDQVLKGEVSPGPVILTFDPWLSSSSCGFLLEPYQEGARLLLALGERGSDGQWRAPLVPPRVLTLETGYEESPLYQYAAATVDQGAAPVRLTIKGPAVLPAGQPVLITVETENRAGFPVLVGLAPGRNLEPSPGPAIEPAQLLLATRWAGGDSVPLRPTRPVDSAEQVVAAGTTGSLTADLAQYFDLSQPGSYRIVADLMLGTGADFYYRDLWYNFGPQFAFTIEPATAVVAKGWGQAKSSTGQQQPSPR